MARKILSEEERQARIAASKRKYEEKKRQEKALLKQYKESLEHPTLAPNYEEMYKTATEELAAKTAKCAELEKICKTYNEKCNLLQTQLIKLQKEANTKIQFILDSAKHAYVTMQLVSNSTLDKEVK